MHLRLNVSEDPEISKKEVAFINNNLADADAFRENRVTTREELDQVLEKIDDYAIYKASDEERKLLENVHKIKRTYASCPLQERLEDFCEYRVGIDYGSSELQKIKHASYFSQKTEDLLGKDPREGAYMPIELQKDGSLGCFAFDLISQRTQVLTVLDYASENNQNVETVRTWLKKGKLPMAFLSGKKWLIPSTAVRSEIRGFEDAVFSWDQSDIIDWPESIRYMDGGDIDIFNYFGSCGGRAVFERDLIEDDLVRFRMDCIVVEPDTFQLAEWRHEAELRVREAEKTKLFFIANANISFHEECGPLVYLRHKLELFVGAQIGKCVTFEPIG